MPTSRDPGSLDEIVLRAGADIRSPLLRTLVELYVQKPIHTSEEEKHFTELMLRLLDQVDADSRRSISRRLASYPSVPEKIARRLAGDVPAPKAPAHRGGEAMAARPAKKAEPISPAELSELFFAARSSERRLILMNIGYATGLKSYAFRGDVREATRELETAALARQPDNFMRALERWLGISPALARQIVSDPLGEPIVVAAKAIGIPADAAQRILLFVNPAVGRSASRVYELATLFETIDASAALALVGIWRAADPRPAARSGSTPEQTETTGLGARRPVAGPTAAEPNHSNRSGPRNAHGKR